MFPYKSDVQFEIEAPPSRIPLLSDSVIERESECCKMHCAFGRCFDRFD